MRLFSRCRSGRLPVIALCGLIVGCVLTNDGMAVWAAQPDQSLQEAGDSLKVNVEDMVAHGGMGDAKAILHHCGEASRYAESILKQLSNSHPGRDESVTSLNEVIRHCKRVSEIGAQADPGVLLNPAIKARTAARSALKSLGLAK